MLPSCTTVIRAIALYWDIWRLPLHAQRSRYISKDIRTGKSGGDCLKPTYLYPEAWVFSALVGAGPELIQALNRNRPSQLALGFFNHSWVPLVHMLRTKFHKDLTCRGVVGYSASSRRRRNEFVRRRQLRRSRLRLWWHWRHLQPLDSLNMGLGKGAGNHGGGG